MKVIVIWVGLAAAIYVGAFVGETIDRVVGEPRGSVQIHGSQEWFTTTDPGTGRTFHCFAIHDGVWCYEP